MNTTKTTRAKKAYEKAQEKFTDHILGLIYTIEDKMVALQSIRDALDSAEYDSKRLDWPDISWDDVVRGLQKAHGKARGIQDDFDDLCGFGNALSHEVANLYAEANALRLLMDKVESKK